MLFNQQLIVNAPSLVELLEEVHTKLTTIPLTEIDLPALLNKIERTIYEATN